MHSITYVCVQDSRMMTSRTRLKRARDAANDSMFNLYLRYGMGINLLYWSRLGRHMWSSTYSGRSSTSTSRYRYRGCCLQSGKFSSAHLL